MSMDMGASKSALKVTEALARIAGFASAQEIYELPKRRGEGIGLSSVYRALASLVELGTIDATRRADGESIYRVCGDGHHHHLICKKCGETIEIEGNSIEKWVSTQAQTHKFREVSHHIEIFGLCRNC